MAENEGVDWSDVPEEMARQIMTQGETYMQAQLQVALASDQRAITMASIFAAIGTAVIAAAVGSWESLHSLPLLVSGLLGGAFTLAGTAACLWAARNVSFFFPGNHPEQWYDGRDERLAIMLGGEAENYQHRIDENQARLAANARALETGFRLVLAAPAVALATWLVATFSPWFPQESRPASLQPGCSAAVKVPTPPQTLRPC